MISFPQVWKIHAANWGMLVSGLVGHLVKSKPVAGAQAE